MVQLCLPPCCHQTLPFTEEEVSKAPEGAEYLVPVGKADLKYSIVVSIPDCRLQSA